MDLKIVQKQGRGEKRKKTTLHLLCTFAAYSLLAIFHLILGPSLLEMNLSRVFCLVTYTVISKVARLLFVSLFPVSSGMERCSATLRASHSELAKVLTSWFDMYWEKKRSILELFDTKCTDERVPRSYISDYTGRSKSCFIVYPRVTSSYPGEVKPCICSLSTLFDEQVMCTLVHPIVRQRSLLVHHADQIWMILIAYYSSWPSVTTFSRQW